MSQTLVGVEVGRLVLGQPPRRPVVLRRIAPARAVNRGDVLERDQDVPVQLHVRDVLDVAVRRQHAFLILAAEERHLDLLALVLACVVLHPGRSLVPGLTVGRHRWVCRRMRCSWCSGGGRSLPSSRYFWGDDGRKKYAPMCKSCRISGTDGSIQAIFVVVLPPGPPGIAPAAVPSEPPGS